MVELFAFFPTGFMLRPLRIRDTEGYFIELKETTKIHEGFAQLSVFASRWKKNKKPRRRKAYKEKPFFFFEISES